MKLVFMMARRLSLSSGGRTTSPAVTVATTAVALSVAVMLVAIAIVVGFKQEITLRVTGFNSDITIYPNQSSESDANSRYLSLSPSLNNLLKLQPYVKDVALQASIPAIFKTRDDFKGLYLKSLAGSDLLNFVSSSLEEGEMPDFSQDGTLNHIVVSSTVAERLDLKVGSSVATYFISDHLRVRNLKVVGIFNSHFQNYDDSWAFGSLALIQQLAALSPSQGTQIAISTADFDELDKNVSDLQHTLLQAFNSGEIFRVYTTESALKSGGAYFQWLDMLDMNIWVVLSLMTAVAAVTLISGMLIMMVDKMRFVALLSVLGARKSVIGRVFMFLAIRVALIGLMAGDILGMALIWLQKEYCVVPLDPEYYYLDVVPMSFSWWAFLGVNVGVLIISWLVLILPARTVKTFSPARILHRE